MSLRPTAGDTPLVAGALVAGALVLVVGVLAPTRIDASQSTVGGPRDSLGIDLAADQKPSDRLPAQFRITLVNRSKRDLFESGPSFIVYVGGDQYAVARTGDTAAEPMRLKPGEKRILTVSLASLRFMAPTGSTRPLSEVEARLARAHWSIVAIMGDVTDVEHSESSLRVQSNEIVFGPHS